MKKRKHDVPHKSTTHEELFFHIENKGTVFFRKEAAGWGGTAALCSPKDQFNRAVGRNVARRRYFQHVDASPTYGEGVEWFDEKPTYREAVTVFELERGYCGLT